MYTDKGRPLDQVMRADDERYERAIKRFDDALAKTKFIVPSLREQEILRAANALRNNVESILRGDEPDL